MPSITDRPSVGTWPNTSRTPHWQSCPGQDTSPYFVGDVSSVLAEIEEFLTGEKVRRVVDRTLATVMFTDIVDSTRLAAELGDQQWLTLLEEHNRLSVDYIERYGGRLVSTTGDGTLATFDGPTRAITCAKHLSSAVQRIGVEIRVGLHTGGNRAAPGRHRRSGGSHRGPGDE